jgi:hypothetical protein
MRAGNLSGSCVAQPGGGPGPVLELKNLADKRSAYSVRQAEAGQLRAGVIQPHGSSGGVENRNQCGNGVQRRGHKAAFDGQGAFAALASTQRLLLGAHAGIELEPRDHLAAEHFKQRDVFQAETGRLARQNGQRADDLFGTGEQRDTGVGAAGFCVHQLDAAGREAGILAGVADQQGLAFLNQPLARRGETRLLRRLEAKLRFEPEAIEIHPSDVRVVGVAEDCGELCEFVQCGVGAAVKHFELLPRRRCQMIGDRVTLHCPHKIHDHLSLLWAFQQGLAQTQNGS